MRISLSKLTGWRAKSVPFLRGHALNFLSTRWSTAFHNLQECGINSRRGLHSHRPRRACGEREIVLAQERCRWGVLSLLRTNWLTILQPFDPFTFTLYQQDTYVLMSNKPITFAPLPYPSQKSHLFLVPRSKLEHGSALRRTKRDDWLHLANLLSLYGKNAPNTPIPSFSERYSQNMPLYPSFVFRTFCVALWCLDEYWCLSCLNAQSCGSEYVRSQISAQCRLSRIQYSAIAIENGSRLSLTNFFKEMLFH